MTNNEPDLAEIIFCFLSKLPETIRREVIVFVLIYAFDFVLTSKDSDLTEELRRKLLEPDGLGRIGSVIRCASSTDHVLASFVATGHANEWRLPRLVQDERLSPNLRLGLQKTLLGRELRLRHTEAALQSWKALRDNELSPSSLMRFEDRCLMLPNRK